MPSPQFSDNAATDRCGCKCFNPNGIIVILGAQVLMLIAACLSSFAVFDCHFVAVDADKVDPGLEDIFKDMFNTTIPVDEVSNDKKRGLGFFFYEGVDGECVWDHFEDLSDRVDSNEWEDRFEDGFKAYRDFLGSDWDVPRALGVTAATLGWCFLLWLLVFSCISHVKALRWILGALVVVCMVVFQGSTFAVMDSDFCDMHGCDLGRSSRCGIAALVLAAVAGILLFFTEDHPGQQQDHAAPFVITPKIATASVTELHDGDEEEAQLPTIDNGNGVTEIQEVAVTADVDESLFDMNRKKSIENTTTAVVTE